MEMPSDPLQSGTTQKELAGALLAACTTQVGIMVFDMGIHFNTQWETNIEDGIMSVALQKSTTTSQQLFSTEAKISNTPKIVKAVTLSKHREKLS